MTEKNAQILGMFVVRTYSYKMVACATTYGVLFSCHMTLWITFQPLLVLLVGKATISSTKTV